MNNLLSSPSLPGRVRGRVLAALGVALIVGAASLSAQDNNRRRTDNGGGGNNGNFNPQDMQARMMTAMRERFDVANDEEWGLISDRITKVMDLRRGSLAGAMSMFGRGGPGGGGGDRTNNGGGGRGTRTGSNVEVSALQAAVTDKLPDAEIKARLDRYREVKRDNEAKLAKAQEELRAVLSVRQEAVAVLAGLLP